MTLRRQLILILALMFLLVFAGTFSITVDNTRRYLTTQLASHAQDTATSLALSLTPHMDDVLRVKSMVDAVFDRGEYRRIMVENLRGEALVSRQLPVKVYGVPDWFVRQLPLETPEASAKLMAGWRQAGQLRVASHPGLAYGQLWSNVVQIFWWSLAALAIALLLTVIALRVVLRSLARVESQALAIAQREFPRIDHVPKSRELRRVVLAMNNMTEKVEDLLAEQHEQSERLREAAYGDPVTGLGNQRAFERELEQLTASRDEHAYGLVGVVGIRGLEAANLADGYQLGDALLQRAADRIRTIVAEREGSAARLGGGLFGIILPDIPSSEVEQTAAPLVRALADVSVAGLDPAGVNIGFAHFGGGQTAEVLSERAESALANAESDGVNLWHLYDDGETAAGRDVHREDRWREVLNQVIDRGEVVINVQPVRSPRADGKPIHLEVFARLMDQAGELVPAGVFFPMAARMGLAEALDRAIVQAAMEVAGKDEQKQNRFALNLSRHALESEAFSDWLLDVLRARPGIAARLDFEVTETMVARIPETVLETARRLRAAGSGFGVDHCGSRDLALDYLKSLKANYTKIDGSFIRGLEAEADKRVYVRSLVATARALGTKTVALHVESEPMLEAVEALGFDGVQGYFIGRPEPI
jgi:diguanylate cyclase (GGDEF)-like protein